MNVPHVIALGLLALVLFFGGCHLAPAVRAPKVLVATESGAGRARDSAIAAHVAQAREDNAQNAPSLPQRAVDLHLNAARAALPSPTPEDAQKAAALSAAVYSGDAEKAAVSATAAQARLATLAAEHEREREERTAQLNRTISEFNAALTAAQSEAQRQAQLRITTVFALLGGGVVILGVVSSITGWSRIGVSLIPAGVALGGSGLLWGRPWFLYTVGGSLALCCVACGILWAVQVSRQREEPL